jgi:prepilin peptidase CpaA
MVLGLAWNSWQHGFTGGFLLALAGLGTGLALLLPLYALRIMGAGDVKLMAAVGAFLGLPDVLFAIVWSFIAGGVAAIAFALYHRSSRRMAANVAAIVQWMAFAAMAGVRPAPELAGRRASIGKLPYAVSIAAGTTGWLLARLAGLA